MFPYFFLGHLRHELILPSISGEKIIQDHPTRNNKELLGFHFTSERDKNKLHCQSTPLLINLYPKFLNL